MGRPKAGLEWHGSTLLRRAVGILGRATDGPVLVVRAPGQSLPPLPAEVELIDDPAVGRGPMQGIAAGLAALDGRAEMAFVTATDLPFLTPASVRHVLDALDERHDIVLPRTEDRLQPLAAGYRTSLAPLLAERVARRELRVMSLVETLRAAGRVLTLDDVDPDELSNVNSTSDYRAALARPAPLVTVQGHELRAATLGAAASSRRRATATVWLNGEPVPAAVDPGLPLVPGDVVHFV